jgi:hypothetical protein
MSYKSLEPPGQKYCPAHDKGLKWNTTVCHDVETAHTFAENEISVAARADNSVGVFLVRH